VENTENKIKNRHTTRTKNNQEKAKIQQNKTSLV